MIWNLSFLELVSTIHKVWCAKKVISFQFQLEQLEDWLVWYWRSWPPNPHPFLPPSVFSSSPSPSLILTGSFKGCAAARSEYFQERKSYFTIEDYLHRQTPLFANVNSEHFGVFQKIFPFLVKAWVVRKCKKFLSQSVARFPNLTTQYADWNVDLVDAQVEMSFIENLLQAALESRFPKAGN